MLSSLLRVHTPLCHFRDISPTKAGLSHMEADEHHKLLLPLGRRWPEGSDEGGIDLNSWIFVVLAGTPSSAWRHLLPAGEKGDSGDLRSYAIPLPTRGEIGNLRHRHRKIIDLVSAERWCLILRSWRCAPTISPLVGEMSRSDRRGGTAGRQNGECRSRREPLLTHD